MDNFHLWGIRSWNYGLLDSHRSALMVCHGFQCGPVEKSRGWKEDLLPPGKFFFSVKVPKIGIPQKVIDGMVAWDRQYSGDEIDPPKIRGNECSKF